MNGDEALRSATLPADAAGATPILCLEGVSKRYGDRLVLDGIALDVADDRCVSLLGASQS